jgi:hypothetical protein
MSASTPLPASGNGNPRPARRWCVPPAILREAGETLEGVHILTEFPSHLGLLLFVSARDVTLWSSVPGGARADVFAPAAAQRRRHLHRCAAPPPELAQPMGVLESLVARPADSDPAELAAACLAVSDWAGGEGGAATALTFAQAGATASPRDPAPALRAGTLALRQGKDFRGESWLRRAVGLARHGIDRRAYGEAQVQLGGLYLGRGDLPAAEKAFMAGVRAGQRCAAAEVRAGGYHGLFQVSIARGDEVGAERFARLAVRIRGREHEGYRALAHGLASLWVGQGKHARALVLLRELAPARRDTATRGASLALLARAAAGAGEAEEYDRAWSQAWTLLRRLGVSDTTHHPFVDLARAARSAGDLHRLNQALRAARAVAANPRDSAAVTAAEAEIRAPA